MMSVRIPNVFASVVFQMLRRMTCTSDVCSKETADLHRVVCFDLFMLILTRYVTKCVVYLLSGLDRRWTLTKTLKPQQRVQSDTASLIIGLK